MLLHWGLELFQFKPNVHAMLSGATLFTMRIDLLHPGFSRIGGFNIVFSEPVAFYRCLLYDGHWKVLVAVFE